MPTTPPTRRCGLRPLMSAAVLLACALPAAGAEWQFPGGSQFYDLGGNWDTGTAPGAGDLAEFIGANTGSVFWDVNTGDTASAQLDVDEAVVSFGTTDADTEGVRTHTAGGVLVDNTGALTLGIASASLPMNLEVNGSLLLENGGDFSALFGSSVTTDFLSIGFGFSGTSVATISGAGSSLNNSGTTQIASEASGILNFSNGSTGNVLAGVVQIVPSSGFGDAGALNITGGSTLTAGSFEVGTRTGTTSATLQIDGAGSALTQTGASEFELGSFGLDDTSTVTVSNGGVFTTGTGLFEVFESGTVDINSGGTFNANGDLRFVGGTFNVTNATFNLAAGKTLTADMDSTLTFTGSYNIDGGTTFRIEDRTEFTVTSFLDVGSGTDGTLVLSDFLTRLTTNTVDTTFLDWGRAGATGSVTISNSAEATIHATRIDIGVTGNADTTGTVQIDGGSMTANSINLANGAMGSGSITLNSSGELTLRNASVFNVGGSGVGTALLQINDGGVTTGTGLTTIGANGRVEINGFGQLEVKGDINIAGGQLVHGSSNGFDQFDLSSANSKLTVSDGGIVQLGNDFRVDQGQTLEANTGGDLQFFRGLDIGVGTDGTVIVDGLGSMLSTETSNPDSNTLMSIGTNGGVGILIVRNQADAFLGADTVSVGDSSASGTLGTVNVLSGASLTTNSLRIGVNGNGTVTILGTNSSLTMTGVSLLDVGGFGGSTTGTLNLAAGGTLTTGFNTTFIADNGVVNLNGGHLVASVIDHTFGGTFSFIAGSLGVERFVGDLTNQGGTLRVGNTPPPSGTRGLPADNNAFGVTNIVGDYSQFAGATVSFDLFSNTSPSSSYDQLDVDGRLTLDGTIEIVVQANGVLSLGDTFQLLEWDTLDGEFSQAVIVGVDPGFSFDLSDLHTSGQARYALAGDLNADGFVGVEDLDLLLANWGDSTSPLNYAHGDLSGDGLVGDADLQLVIANWGNGTPGGTVPEPGSAALLGFGVLSLLRRRRRVV
ncbi:PEP-CTERM sorting domain-containing protein [Phycisphaeraceae bacterium D3-23]